MNSQERKPKFPPERSGDGKSILKLKHGESTSRDIAEKPFPCKPVCHKRLVKSTSHDLDLEKKCVTRKAQNVPNSTSQDKDSSRLDAAELKMTKAIREKQLMLQMKLWKVEDALRERLQRDNVGVNDYKGNQTVEKKHYERKQELVNPDTKTKKKTEVRGSEMLTERQNPKQYKFRKDTITQISEQSAKWDEIHVGETLTKKEESRASFWDRGNAAGRTLHEELVIPQVSSSPSWKPELESSDKNAQLVPCDICKRKFLRDRLEKHMQICEKVKKAKRPVFNSFLHRTKGSALEDFWKTNTRSRPPETLRKKKQSQHPKT
ncbi:zinc finger C2HC domain-containing protein 1C-like isoform X2 [Eucyclogobius newberryi]|uniref:zinc finger C2HC domain-containing protein 1C-like isoform X2 n=1 Tax=Eucyclogobius newberryi TaxID=166745 RepID=UPI003B5CE2E5